MKLDIDIKLLDLMIHDLEGVDASYKPVWFWEDANKFNINMLKKQKYFEFGDIRSSFFSASVDYYLQYLYCNKQLNFDNIDIIVELGGGYGKQVEIIKKNHPNICFLLFDIPPQLYLCELFLKSVFKDRVVSYKTGRNLNELPIDNAGKIFILPAFKFPIIENIDVDLFWNSSSFQEMHRDSVRNYLNYVNKSTNYIFLNEVMKGKRSKDEIYNKITLNDYIKNLNKFELLDLSPAWSIENKLFDKFCNIVKPYSDYFFKKMIMLKNGNSYSLWKRTPDKSPIQYKSNVSLQSDFFNSFS
jgi:hypothetical protein